MSYEGAKRDALITQIQQIIKESTHILTESSCSIDLITKSHQNLVMESEVCLSLNPNSHHQIT